MSIGKIGIEQYVLNILPKPQTEEDTARLIKAEEPFIITEDDLSCECEFCGGHVPTRYVEIYVPGAKKLLPLYFFHEGAEWPVSECRGMFTKNIPEVGGSRGLLNMCCSPRTYSNGTPPRDVLEELARRYDDGRAKIEERSFHADSLFAKEDTGFEILASTADLWQWKNTQSQIGRCYSAPRSNQRNLEEDILDEN